MRGFGRRLAFVVLAGAAFAAGCAPSMGTPPATGAAGNGAAGAGGSGGTPAGGTTGGSAAAGASGAAASAGSGVAGAAGSNAGAGGASGGGGVSGASGGGAAGGAGAGGRGGASGGAGIGGGGRGGAAGSAGAGGRGGAGGGAGAGGAPATVEMLDITDVWSGHPVAFSLVTRGDQQFAAFFDANRRMTVAQRTLGTTAWQLTRLDNTLGWDSHNYVTMAIDSTGFVHVAGNMHNVPLIYYRSTRALDASSLARVTSMVGSNEQSVTYPEFFQGPTGNLVFIYRDGGSGNGNHIFNTYDTGTRAWRRLLGTPLTDGQGQRNAYPVGPVLGPDGFYHLVWVWRDTPDAATNHDLSYAKSRDLVQWQSAAGTPLTLPVTLGHQRHRRSGAVGRRHDQQQHQGRLRQPEPSGGRLSQVRQRR